MLAPQETACIVSSFAILLFALAGFDVSGIAPARIAAVLLILLGARCGREAGGSIAGIVAGVAMGFGEGFRFLTGSYALAACWPDCSPRLGNSDVRQPLPLPTVWLLF